jgi:hypothetical protein
MWKLVAAKLYPHPFLKEKKSLFILFFKTKIPKKKCGYVADLLLLLLLLRFRVF